MIVDEVCGDQRIVSVSVCEESLTKVYNFVKEKACPDTILEALPSSVCKVATNEELEKMIVDKVCAKQNMVPASECEEGLTKAYDFLKEKACPTNTTFEALPSLPHRVCSVVKNEEVEKTIVDEVCGKQEIVSASDCEEGLRKVYDFVKEKACPDTIL